MTDLHMLTVRLADRPDDDEDKFEQLTRDARHDLMELDVESAEMLEPTEVPPGAKGIGGISGWLAVNLGSLPGLRGLVDAMRDFAGRTSRTVEITLGGDMLKVSGVTSSQQEKLIEAWLERQLNEIR